MCLVNFLGKLQRHTSHLANHMRKARRHPDRLCNQRLHWVREVALRDIKWDRSDSALNDPRRRSIMKTSITAAALSCLIAILVYVGSANAAPPTDATRERALKECNALADKYVQHT